MASNSIPGAVRVSSRFVRLTGPGPGRSRGFPAGCDGPDLRGLIMDVATLTDLLREAEKRHGAYEATAPKHHWSGWYAAYIVARERGRTPDDAAKDAALYMEGARR